MNRVATVSLRGANVHVKSDSHVMPRRHECRARHAMRVLTRSCWGFVCPGVLHVKGTQATCIGVGVVWELGKSPVLRGVASIRGRHRSRSTAGTALEEKQVKEW